MTEVGAIALGEALKEGSTLVWDGEMFTLASRGSVNKIVDQDLDHLVESLVRTGAYYWSHTGGK